MNENTIIKKVDEIQTGDVKPLASDYGIMPLDAASQNVSVGVCECGTSLATTHSLKFTKKEVSFSGESVSSKTETVTGTWYTEGDGFSCNGSTVSIAKNLNESTRVGHHYLKFKFRDDEYVGDVTITQQPRKVGSYTYQPSSVTVTNVSLTASYSNNYCNSQNVAVSATVTTRLERYATANDTCGASFGDAHKVQCSGTSAVTVYVGEYNLNACYYGGYDSWTVNSPYYYYDGTTLRSSSSYVSGSMRGSMTIWAECAHSYYDVRVSYADNDYDGCQSGNMGQGCYITVYDMPCGTDVTSNCSFTWSDGVWSTMDCDCNNAYFIIEKNCELGGRSETLTCSIILPDGSYDYVYATVSQSGSYGCDGNCP